MATDLTSPSSKESGKAHTNADTDGKPTSLHHTLGSGPMQSAPGNHLHDGGTSVLLLEGTTLTGSRASGAALISVIDALKQLGVNDATTA